MRQWRSAGQHHTGRTPSLPTWIVCSIGEGNAEMSAGTGGAELSAGRPFVKELHEGQRRGGFIVSPALGVAEAERWHALHADASDGAGRRTASRFGGVRKPSHAVFLRHEHYAFKLGCVTVDGERTLVVTSHRDVLFVGSRSFCPIDGRNHHPRRYGRC